MYDHWSDRAASWFDFIFGPVTLVSNILLVYIIVRNTPKSTRTYAAIILLMTISDCVGAICNTMAAGRVTPMDPEIYLIFRGPCTLCFKNNEQFRAQACQLWYTILIASYMLNHSVLLLSYAYRSVIILQPFKWFDDKYVYVILGVYTLVHYTYLCWAHYMAMEPMSVVIESFMKVHPEIVQSNLTYYAIVDQKAPSQLVFYYASRLSPWLVLIVAFGCRWRVDRYLTSFTFSESTRELQKAVGKIFLAQTLGPILISIMSFLYLINAYIGLTEERTAIFENFMAKPLLLMYIVNPTTTIYFVTPYRMAFLKLIGRHPVKVSGPVSVVNVSSTRGT